MTPRLLVVRCSLLVVLLATSNQQLVTAWAAYDARDQRDPFAALISSEGVLLHPEALTATKARAPAGHQTLMLEGILYDPRGASLAIINGEVLRVGEALSGVEVVTIEPSRVVVLQNGREHELRMPVLEPIPNEGGA